MSVACLLLQAPEIIMNIKKRGTNSLLIPLAPRQSCKIKAPSHPTHTHDTVQHTHTHTQHIFTHTQTVTVQHTYTQTVTIQHTLTHTDTHTKMIDTHIQSHIHTHTHTYHHTTHTHTQTQSKTDIFILPPPSHTVHKPYTGMETHTHTDRDIHTSRYTNSTQAWRQTAHTHTQTHT